MNVLYIDTAGKKIEFAYNKKGDFCILKRLDESKNADDLVYEIKKEFDEQGFCFQDIDFAALLNGPGSYTGLRIGSAITKAICFATGAVMVEINSIDLIAEKYFMKGSRGKATALVFSGMKTGEFFHAAYEDGVRISEYKSSESGEIEGQIYLLNEKINLTIHEDVKILDLSEDTNIYAMDRIVKRMIEKKETSNYATSEPFYMKQFPVKKT